MSINAGMIAGQSALFATLLNAQKTALEPVPVESASTSQPEESSYAPVPPGLLFGANLTPEKIAAVKLKELVEAMIGKFQKKQISMPGAMISPTADSPDLAKLVVMDPERGDRIYLVAKFTQKNAVRKKPGENDAICYDLTQYPDGNVTKKPMRSIQLIRDDNGIDRLIYDDTPEGGKTAKPPLTTSDILVTRRFREFMKTLEENGLFDPSGELDSAKSDELVF